MEQKLIDLETRLAFQEHTLQELNDVIVVLRNEVDVVTRRLQAAEERLRAIEPAVLTAGGDEKPPHY